MKRKRIVVIGGGTGAYTVLTGLKNYLVDLTAVVTMMDSGGSNRVIRDEFGLLPISDIRQCMVALASDKSHELLRQLFTYRYRQGTGITGMTFGNLFMAALTDIFSSQEKAIAKTCEILDVRGQILPVTFDNVQLVARYENGQQVLGEHWIDEPLGKNGKYKIVSFETIPEAEPNKKALAAIAGADLIILGPGDLFTSTISNLVVKGVAKAIRTSPAKKIYVLNLMTKFGQTNGFKASDHIHELEKYLGKGAIDICLISKFAGLPPSILKRYQEEKAQPVKDDFKSGGKMKVIRGNFISGRIIEKDDSDTLLRSLVRHDPAKLAEAIISLL